MGKKKAFIDKKHATTYSLVYAGDDGSETEGSEGHEGEVDDTHVEESKSSGIRRVLVPVDDLGQQHQAAAPGTQGVGGGAPPAPPSWLLAKMGIREPELPVLEAGKRREILGMGFPDDGYDYTQHLREARPDTVTMVTASSSSAAGQAKEAIPFALEGGDGEGGEEISAAPDQGEENAFLSEDVKLVDARRLALKREIPEEEQEKYDLGNFPVPDPSQARHRQMERKYVSSTLSEIEQVMQELEMADERECGDLQEDFLLLATEGADEQEEDGQLEDFGGWDDEDYDYGDIPEGEELERRRRDASERAAELTKGRELMEECFDQLVDEYDHLEIGDLEDADLDQTLGPGIGAERFDGILDEFLDEKRGKEYVVYERVEDAPGPAAMAAATPEAPDQVDASVGVRVERYDLDDETRVLSGHADLELKEKTRELAMRASAEDDGGGLVGERDRIAVEVPAEETWDCESVLSLVSNLDNHPALLTSASKRNKERRPKAIPEGEEEEEDDEEEEGGLVVDAEALVRKKGETAEEKKLRKQLVKQAKREARQRKKEKKVEFKHIKMNRQQQQQQQSASIRPY